MKDLIKTRRIKLGFLFLLALLTACGKSDSTTTTTEGFDVLNFSDDTPAAAELVSQANEDLNKIKVMYKKNEDQLEELKTAMKDNNIEKVKKITDDLVYIINDGMGLAESAVEKIEKAEAMNVNPDFKEYLDLKAQGLRKQLEAFEERRQAARLLRDVFGANDAAMIEKSKLGFKEKEDHFQKIMDEAREVGKKANEVAKRSSAGQTH